MDIVVKNKITSLELIEQINIFREQEGNRKELQHKDLLKVIRDEFEEEINEGKISPVEYKDKKGELRPMFDLTINQAKQVLMRESKYVRKAMIHYIESLERELKKTEQTKLPATYLEALKELVKTEEKRMELENKVSKLTHQNKLYTTTEIAKELGFKSANALNKKMEEDKIQYKINGTWVLCARFSEKGYVSIKQTELDNGKIVYDRKWTGIGRDFLLERYLGDII